MRASDILIPAAGTVLMFGVAVWTAYRIAAIPVVHMSVKTKQCITVELGDGSHMDCGHFNMNGRYFTTWRHE